MIFFTMGDAAKEISPVVNGGSCEDEVVYDRINRATRRLMNRNKKPLHIRRLVRFFTKKDIITLPNEVEKILHYTMDSVPSPMFSQAYEFVSHGPGEIGCGTCISSKYLEDLGNYYSLMFDVPSVEVDEAGEETDAPLRLVAFSTAEGDRGKELLIASRNASNEIMGIGARVALPINQWADGVEGNFMDSADSLSVSDPVKDVTWVTKPVTDAHVTLYAYNPDTHAMFFLAKYHPDETQPKYRRYRITAPDCKCGSSILAWCELGYVPHTRATDVLTIQNIDALKLMVMANEMEAERDFQMAKAYEADAYRLIEEQRLSERTHDYNLLQVSEAYGFGGIRRA